MYCEEVPGLDLFIKCYTILKKFKKMFSVQELGLEQQLHRQWTQAPLVFVLFHGASSAVLSHDPR